MFCSDITDLEHYIFYKLKKQTRTFNSIPPIERLYACENMNNC